TSNVLTSGDTMDLRTALAATNWNGSAATLSKYLSVASNSTGAVLSISPTSGGSSFAVATIQGATGTNYATLLAHAIT
ncbi:MAG: type I secretion C-terminal target domain-containing protein, partial [Acetobacteraceae bacterium]|nr:type I secretion C-terminal target domain-containing protein [Acetobacteraceae bacterium]